MRKNTRSEGRELPAEITEIRRSLDEIDAQLMQLLQERFSQIDLIAQIKSQQGGAVYDQLRELQIFQKVKDSTLPEYQESMVHLWAHLLRKSRERQYKCFVQTGVYTRFSEDFVHAPTQLDPIRRIGHIGTSASSLAQLVRRGYPSVITVPCTSFQSAFQSLLEENVDALFLPLEDSVAGSFQEVYHLLIETGSYLVKTVTQQLPYQLWVRPGTSFSAIDTVVAHPKVLLDCQSMIQSMGWNRIEEQSQEAAVQLTARYREGHVAAISTGYEAIPYGLEALSTALPLEQGQTLRYGLIQRKMALLPGWQHAVFSLQMSNQPRILSYIASVLGEAGFNIRKLRTHEVPRSPWSQQLLVELDLRPEQKQKLIEIFTMLDVEGNQFRLLGIFPNIHLKDLEQE